jgi:Trehalose and maltose hydrolases (possible phosphorylases)
VANAIDRAALVRRHCPEVRAFDPASVLTVGNGEFAFTADATGLQTFPELYRERVPLCTAAHWGWHSCPAPAGASPADIRATDYDTFGRPVGYITDRAGQEALFDWLRQNPHRLHLGRIGLLLLRRSADGALATPDDLTDLRQTFDLWTGVLHSRFRLAGQPVAVTTCCHPDQDLLAVRIESPLLVSGQVGVVLAFPYGSPGMDMADWDAHERHATDCVQPHLARADFARALDTDHYHVALAWTGDADLTRRGPHEFHLAPRGGEVLELVCRFSPEPHPEELPGFGATAEAAAAHWQRFWSEGGAVDLSDSSDPRAAELERRVVLSQYLTAVHCAGSLPPAETGLLCNSWYGKFHLEMHWWHAAHFAAWGRFPRLARSLAFYHRTLPAARALAARQGYAGARWPKMVGPDGSDAPSPVGPLLIWQQPHPIYYAELAYRAAPSRETLEEWAEVVFATAEFLADYAHYDAARGRYVLGPPLKTVSENTDARAASNPPFELSYWRFGLRAAQQWRGWLGLPPVPRWDEVRSALAPLPVGTEGAYLLQEGLEDTYTRWNWEHPAQLGPLGALPGDGADAETMRRTVRRVMECWRWAKKSWGWDFPLAAMAAARAGEPELAVRALLLDAPTNHYGPNGHVYQRPDLPAYLPANGGLLAAVGMMAAGWEGEPAPRRPAPGFPNDGRWSVRHEKIRPWL